MSLALIQYIDVVCRSHLKAYKKRHVRPDVVADTMDGSIYKDTFLNDPMIEANGEDFPAIQVLCLQGELDVLYLLPTLYTHRQMCRCSLDVAFKHRLVILVHGTWQPPNVILTHIKCIVGGDEHNLAIEIGSDGAVLLQQPLKGRGRGMYCVALRIPQLPPSVRNKPEFMLLYTVLDKRLGVGSDQVAVFEILFEELAYIRLYEVKVTVFPHLTTDANDRIAQPITHMLICNE